MRKLTHWLYKKFLPAWCKDSLLEANSALAKQAERQQQEISRLQAYIDGLEYGLRRGGDRR